MTESSTVIWRSNIDDKWVLFNNNQYQPLIVKEKAKNETKETKNIKKKENNTPFYFAKVKIDTKGSLVYSPKGYGIVQGIKIDQGLITVKVNNEIQDFKKNDISNEIPISLTFISNSGRIEDKVLLPIHSTAKDIIEKIEREQENENAARIFYKGKELTKSSETLEKMGITPLAKFLIITIFGKPLSVSRFPITNQGWGYSSSVDGITFSPSKDIRVIGFGIYTPENDTVIDGTAKFIQGSDAKGMIAFSKDISFSKNSENTEEKVYRFMFDKPLKVKAGEQYCCVVAFKSGTSYYGSGGLNTVTGEQDVVFTFTDCTGSSNGTGISSGQIPAIYYNA